MFRHLFSDWRGAIKHVVGRLLGVQYVPFSSCLAKNIASLTLPPVHLLRSTPGEKTWLGLKQYMRGSVCMH